MNRKMRKVHERMLIGEVKLTDFGAAPLSPGPSKEDERSAALAARAQKGDYDDGLIQLPSVILIANADIQN
jgi:hypothetical protein